MPMTSMHEYGSCSKESTEIVDEPHKYISIITFHNGVVLFREVDGTFTGLCTKLVHYVWCHSHVTKLLFGLLPNTSGKGFMLKDDDPL